MKKIFVLIALLTIAAACSTPPASNETTSTTNANSAAPARPAMTEADAIAKEKAIWEAIKNKEYDAFAAMVDEDQLEVRAEGVVDKATSVDGVKQFEPSEVNFSDWKYLPIDKDAFVVIYQASVKGKYQGKEFKPQTANNTSAWVYRGNKWLAIYHQESEVKPEPPAAKPGPSPKAGASPAASPAPAPATSSDAIANEKIVWDLFKSKNYDAFAELLAPNFTEVESTGIYDKDGSIKGVSMIDGSKAVLSDWKALKLNDDAALVTYTLKLPGSMVDPAGERHATIWVKQNSKWLALSHHGGTPVRKATPIPPPPAASPAAKASPAPKPTY
jgi:hypothetical protein